MALEVVVYVKPGCTLCEPVMRTVEKVRERLPFELSKVDISSDPALMERYGMEVPVVTIDGRKAFKGHVTEAALRKKLEKARELQATRPQARETAADVARPFVPSRAVALVFLTATVAGFGWFIQEGLVSASRGDVRLAAELLRIEPRNDQPVRFQLESIDGRKVSLDDYRDKIVFLNFWATWCPPCVEEMPSMIRMSERLRGNPKVVMLAVSADESWDVVRRFWDNKPPPPFQVLLDANGKIAKEYGTTMFPETFVIVNGRIVAFIEGPRDWDKWYAEGYLEALGRLGG